MKGLGIVLIVIGLVMLIFRGFNFTQQKKVAEVGPIEINKTQEKSVNWPMYAGGIAMAAGVFILLSGTRKKS